MKTCILAFTLLTGSLLPKIAQAGAPTQSTVDQYIAMAITINPEELLKPGKFSCESEFSGTTPVKVSADSLQNAQTKYLLQCIRNECEKLDSKISEAVVDVLKLSDEEMRDYLYSMGYSEAEIQKALDAKKNPPNNLPKVTCKNATPLARMFVVDSCSVYPIRCGKN